MSRSTSTLQQEQDASQAIPAWARLLDATSLVLIGVSLYIAAAGEGFVVRLAGLRLLSVKSPLRVLAWAGALVLFRHLIVRRNPLHERLKMLIRSVAQHDDFVLLNRGRQDGSPARETTRRRAIVNAIGIVLIFAGLTAVMTYPQVRLLDRGVPVEMGDALFSTWRLAWFAHQLPRDPLHLFDANIFYPERLTLAYSDAMVVPSLMAAPLLWLGVEPLLTYNLLLLSAFVLSGAAMFALVRSLTGHSGAALVAGFVFAFLPYRYMHYEHLELQMTHWMPLSLWALHSTLKRGRVPDGLLTGLFLALQMLSSWYYGIFFATYLVPLGVALWITSVPDLRWRSVKALAAGAALAVLIVLPFALPYMEARQTLGERALWEIKVHSATPENYLGADPRNRLLGNVTQNWGGGERSLFQGISVPVLAVAALWPPLSAARIGYAAALALAWDVSLGVNGLVYPWLHAYVLPYRGLRVPARMGLLVGMSLAILVGYAVARVATRRKPWGSRMLVALALGLVFFEYRSTVKFREVWRRPPPIYELLPREQTVVLGLPLIEPDIVLEPVYMYFSTFHWHKLVNGYSGFHSESYVNLVGKMTEFPDDRSIEELQRRHLQYVVVHGAFYTPEAYRMLTSSLDQRKEFVLVSRDRWDNAEIRLYRMNTSPTDRVRLGAN